MLTHTANLSRGNQWIRIFGVLTAILMLGASADAALSRGEKQIQKKLPSGLKLKSNDPALQANDDQILQATLDAIQSPTNPDVLTSEIVKAAMKYVPQKATVIVAAGLTKVKTISPSLKNSEGKKVVSFVMRPALAGNSEILKASNPADRAAAITAAAVEVVKDLASTDTLFSAAIKGAVSVGAEFSKGSKNGAAGAVTGAIADAAGVSNTDLSDSSDGNVKGDALVKVIISTAAKTAPSRALEIAEASGYAFAGAYRGTTSDASEITLNQFLSNNLEDIFAAVISGLPTKKANKLAIQIHDRVQAGIALAYGGIPTNGSKGVSEFAYDSNGNLPPVTDIAGI